MRGEEVCAGGGIDRPGGLLPPLLPPLPQVRGGVVVFRGRARVRPLATGGDLSHHGGLQQTEVVSSELVVNSEVMVVSSELR